MTLTYRIVEDAEIEKDGPIDGDFLIQQPATGPDVLSVVNGPYIGEFRHPAALCAAIKKKMGADQFWPNVWLENERGRIDLVAIVEE